MLPLQIAVCLVVLCWRQTEASPLTDNFLLIADNETNQIKQVSLADNTVINVQISNGSSPSRVAYHRQSQTIYWSDPSNGKLNMVTLNGTSTATSISLGQGAMPSCLAVEGSTGSVYYSDQNNKSVRVIGPRGQTGITTIISGLANPSAIALDSNNRQIYVADLGTQEKVIRTDMDGNNQIVVLSGNLGKAIDLTLDSAGNRLYWCDQNGGRVERSFLNGTDRNLIYNSSLYQFSSLAFAQGFLYLTDVQNGYIMKMTPDGSNLTQLSSGEFKKPVDIKAYLSVPAQEPLCDDLISNGVLSSECSRMSGENCTYQCNDGYEATTSQISCVGGQWHPNASTLCNKVRTCRPLTPPANSYIVSCPAPHRIGSNCEFKCYSNYHSSGSRLRTCEEDLTWSGSSLTCTVITCPSLMVPENADKVFCVSPARVGEACKFTCRSGYQRSAGSEIRTCYPTGSWGGSELQCTPATTQEPAGLDGGAVAGVVVAMLFVLALVIGVFVSVRYLRSRDSDEPAFPPSRLQEEGPSFSEMNAAIASKVTDDDQKGGGTRLTFTSRDHQPRDIQVAFSNSEVTHPEAEPEQIKQDTTSNNAQAGFSNPAYEG